MSEHAEEARDDMFTPFDATMPVTECPICSAAIPDGPAHIQKHLDFHASLGERAPSGEAPSLEEASVLLALGAGQVTDIDLPDGCTAVRFECADGTAQVMYQFPGQIQQHVIAAASLGPRRITVPGGASSVKVTRFDDGPDDVTVTLEF